MWAPKRVLNSNFQPNTGVRTIKLFSKIEIFFIRSKSKNCQLPPFRLWTSSRLYMACVGPQEGVKLQFSAKSRGAHHYTFLKNRNFLYKVKIRKLPIATISFVDQLWASYGVCGDPKRVLNSNFQPNPGVRTIKLFSKIEILFIR